MMGKIVTLYLNPKEAVVGCLPTGQGQKVCGEIVGVRETEPFGTGKIPDLLIRIRGRSGRIMETSMVESYAAIHPDWPTAIADLDLP